MKSWNFFCRPLVLAVALGNTAVFPAKCQLVVAGLTPETAIQIALTNNPDLCVLAADIAAARAAVTTATTWQNPDLSVRPGFKSVREPATTTFHGDFGLEQTFEWPGKRALRKAVAEKNVAVRQLALEGFRAQLAIHVRRVYSTVLAAREVVALREQRLALAKSFVDAAKKRAEVGFAPEFEVTKAQVELVAAQKNVREAQAQQDAARVMLNVLMGRQPTEPIAITGALATDVALPSQVTLLERALAQNPAVKVQAAEAERTGLSLQSIRKSRLPDFKVGPNVEYTRDEQIVGFGVSLPLPLWDNKKGEIAAATAEQAKALAELEKLRREIQRDAVMAVQNLAAARESLAFYSPALREKLKSALDAAAQSYAEGKLSFLIYLETQRTYFDTQADYFEMLKKSSEARAELESAVGVPLDQLTQTETETETK